MIWRKEPHSIVSKSERIHKRLLFQDNSKAKSSFLPEKLVWCWAWWRDSWWTPVADCALPPRPSRRRRDRRVRRASSSGSWPLSQGWALGRATAALVGDSSTAARVPSRTKTLLALSRCLATGQASVSLWLTALPGSGRNEWVISFVSKCWSWCCLSVVVVT